MAGGVEAPLARRARWQMGTLVEVAADLPAVALEPAFAGVQRVDARMSTFRADSDLSRLNRAQPGVRVPMHADTLHVLRAALALHALTDGAFDAACGSGGRTAGFAVARDEAWRTGAHVHVSLDGIAKGFAVDVGVAALLSVGATRGWVNAGGDLRVFGALSLPVEQRAGGGARRLLLCNRAMATSEYGAGRRVTSASTLHGRCGRVPRSYGATVIAHQCMIADALTKAVAVRRRRAGKWARALDADVLWRA